jgi:hypothetical protein
MMPPRLAPSRWLHSQWTGPIHAVRVSLWPLAHRVPGSIHRVGMRQVPDEPLPGMPCWQ